MVGILKRSLILIMVLAAVSGGYVYGHGLGDAHRTFHVSHSGTGFLSLHGGLVGETDSGQEADSSVPPSDVYDTVLDHVQHEFVESSASNSSRLNDGALTRMFASLDDPRTSYLDPALRRARQEALEGVYHGIGASFAVTRSRKGDLEYRHLTILDVTPGGPAEKAGLKSGDFVTHIDDHWIIAYSLRVDLDRIDQENKTSEARSDAAKSAVARFSKGFSLAHVLPLLMEGEGEEHSLSVERAGGLAPLNLKVTTGLTKLDSVESRVIDGRVGYLRIRQFNTRAGTEIERAVNRFAGEVSGWIVDLRGNPGGVSAESDAGVDGYRAVQKTISLLTRGGIVAQIEHRPGHHEPLKIAAGGSAKVHPIVVLVDGGTANLAELAAAALRETGKARVVGAHTFGDDILQMFAVLKGGGGVEMTTAHMFTAAGIDLSKGIEPDILLSPTDTGTDSAVDRAISLLGS